MADPDRRFGALPLDAMTPEQRLVADAILAGPRSMSTGLRGPFEALLRSPGLADAAQQLGEQIRFRSSLPTHLNELAINLCARRWTAQFEWWAHRRMAVEAGLDPAVADAVGRGERPEMDDDTAAVHDFARQLLDEGTVDDARFAAVVDRWGQRGAVDLIGAVGYYTLVSFVLNVDRYPVPEGEPLLPTRPA
ncbi:MAG: carboxymuconolactone decarboxylase family protein [Acidimicrobiia bacterium]